MSTVSHGSHRGAGALLALGVGVAGLTVALGLVVAGPSAARAATANAASNQYKVYLVLPSNMGGKSTAPTAVKELLSAFSLSTVAAAPGSTGKPATPASSSASATMAINQASVKLLTFLAAATKSSPDVDFFNSSSGAKVFSYQFTNAVFTSYLLQDGPTGDSVQVTFGYQRLQVDYYAGSPNGSPVTYVIGKAPGG
jgi:hypothetical protein